MASNELGVMTGAVPLQRHSHRRVAPPSRGTTVAWHKVRNRSRPSI